MEDLIKALQIFLKYGNKDYPTHCEHDTMYVMYSPSDVSEEDKAELKRLSFSPDENGYFTSYKYGSA